MSLALLTRLRKLGAALCLALFALSASAGLITQTGPRYFVTDEGGDSEPAAGNVFQDSYDALPANYTAALGSGDGAFRTQAVNATCGPNGIPCRTVTFTYAPGGDEFAEPQFGGRVVLSNFTGTTYRYARWYEYHESANNYDARDGGGFLIKRMFAGSDGGDSRVFILVRAELTSGDLPYVTINFDDNPGAPVDTSTYTKGSWHAIQVRWRFGNGANNAEVAVWIDNDNEGSPTATLTLSPTQTATDSGETKFGAYSNDQVGASGSCVIKDAAFRMSTTFDSNWHGWMVSP